MAASQEDTIPLLPEDKLGNGLGAGTEEVAIKEYPLRTPPPKEDVVFISLQERPSSPKLEAGEGSLRGASDTQRRSGESDEELEQPKAKKKRKKHYSGNEMIVSVFVTAFDTKKGNIIEWKYPDVVNLDGVEFKSMASGLHNVSKDFIYFKQNQLFGLSCFEKIPVSSDRERGVRMRSVGLLAVGYSDLHLHKDFLQRQTRSQLEAPGDYGSLEEYFRHYQSPRQPYIDPGLALATPDLPSMSITHPAGCFSQFLQFFGADIFVLWKLALLKKRIILFSPPPVGVVCYRVYCTCLLGSQDFSLDLETDPNPQFYVNVADIEALRTLDNYVACTTERIFQSKTELYDVFVDNQNITTQSLALEHLLTPTEIDKNRFKHLNNIRSRNMLTMDAAAAPSSSLPPSSFPPPLVTAGYSDDLGFARFFQELNKDLFCVLLEAAQAEDHILTIDMVNSVALHPIKDRHFLTELARLHNLDVNVQRPADVFSCCI